MTTRVALALLVASLLGVGFGARSSTAAERRVATLVPYAGAALAAHADEVRIVATVRSDPRTPVPDGVIDLGSPHSPNLEKLAEARPDFVVTDAQMHGNLAEALGRTGGDRDRAAELLGLHSSTLVEKLRRRNVA